MSRLTLILALAAACGSPRHSQPELAADPVAVDDDTAPLYAPAPADAAPGVPTPVAEISAAQAANISLAVSISSPTLDPTDATATFECSITNGSDAVVAAPTMPGRDLKIEGRGLGHRFPSNLWNRSEEPVAATSVVVGPGGTRTLFKATLAELFGAADDSQWGWDWIARSRPPTSPAHDTGAGYGTSASFWCSVLVATHTVASAPITTSVSAPATSKQR